MTNKSTRPGVADLRGALHAEWIMSACLFPIINGAINDPTWQRHRRQFAPETDGLPLRLGEA